MRARFESHAQSHGVSVDVVTDAAAHVWEMLDEEQRAELVAESLQRWRSSQDMNAAKAGDVADSTVMQDGDTTVVFTSRRNVLRDDLVYRLMHERFDFVYAVAVRAADAPEGDAHAEWLFVPPRPSEEETPSSRAAKLLQSANDILRRARQRCESLRASALRQLTRESR